MSTSALHSRRGDERGATTKSVTGFIAIRYLLLWLTLGYTAFVIYGSLVPLNFHPHPLREAWEQFHRIRYLQLDIGSRADWVANILLFIPLAFLWLSVSWPKRGWLAKALVSGLVLTCSVGLAAAIEFTQIFFPPRTVSLNDVIAECIGALIGAALWWSIGARVADWLAGWSEAHTPSGRAERFLYVYLFLLFGYNLMPLDLTISGVEIYHKWREGKVLLVPFSAHYESWAELAYALFANVAIWIPAALLWRLSSSRPARTVVLYVVACAAVIEVLQLFVYSRVTSTTDVLMAACGGVIGVLLAGRLQPTITDRGASRSSGSAAGAVALWLLALIGWAVVLIVVFWYPFDFSSEWGFVHRRLAAIRRVPFEAYYLGTEFRALTEVFHKAGFFFPLGALLAIGAAKMRRWLPLPAVVWHALSAVVIACAAAGIEIGQVFLPGKNVDATDWLLETLGGLAGYLCLWILRPVWRSESGDATQRQISQRLGARRVILPSDTGGG